MNKNRTPYNNEARQALAPGNLKKALEHYRSQCLAEPSDLRAGLKMAETLERLGRKEEALAAYRGVAEAYAQDGYLAHAISVNKIILRIDPSLEEVRDRLTRLCRERAVGAEV